MIAGVALVLATTLTSPSQLPPCPSEDAPITVSCTWDAQTQGNGQGTDFIVYQGKVYYPAGR